MLSVDEAALSMRVSSRTIFHLADSGGLHFSETPEGLMLICAADLHRLSGVYSV
jgi:excisionase family DNA binding protein